MATATASLRRMFIDGQWVAAEDGRTRARPGRRAGPCAG